jgi:hypothetical protein
MYQLEYMYQCRRFVSFEEKKKGSPFLSLRSKNKLIEAKRKIRREKKRKEAQK